MVPDKRAQCEYHRTEALMNNASHLELPPVPKYSLRNDRVEPLSLEVTRFFTRLTRSVCRDFLVLIISPIHNSEGDLENYVKLIYSLDYPRHQLSLAFGEDNSHDGTLVKARSVVEKLKTMGLRRAEVFHFNFSDDWDSDSWMKEHAYSNQLKRRSHLARARNLLLKSALKDEEYVLWIDSDIKSIPPDLIQQMVYVRGDVVTTSCLVADNGGGGRIYDKNSWRETELSRKRQESLPLDELVVEGYFPSVRQYLPHLRGEGRRCVPVDGVGGCALMIKAECHRKGLIFPETLFERHIETEGLAKMAKHMGYSVYGLPFVNVFHS